MSKDIYRNKRDFAKEEFATELYKPKGKPKPREVKSQKAQFESLGSPASPNRKDTKTKMKNKIGTK